MRILGSTGELDFVRQLADPQSIGFLSKESTSASDYVVPGAAIGTIDYTTKRPVLVNHMRYEVAVTCVNSLAINAITTASYSGDGTNLNAGISSNQLVPMIYDVYFLDLKRDIPSSYSEVMKLYASVTSYPQTFRPTDLGTGARLHSYSSAEYADQDCSITPYDMPEIVRFFKIYDKKRFICTPGQTFTFDNTIMWNKIYRRQNDDTLALKQWAKAYIICAHDPQRTAADLTHGTNSGTFQLSQRTRFGYKPVPTAGIRVTT
jgi:hypothetical protein